MGSLILPKKTNNYKDQNTLTTRDKRLEQSTKSGDEVTSKQYVFVVGHESDYEFPLKEVQRPYQRDTLRKEGYDTGRLRREKQEGPES